ncbi:hypothetical protein GMLC_06370 [Geomonas limicola]|uniref:Uncharacterized protein n=1 Tax=Geomonas limicola TaxID=2740186 RepID=A0A6V8N3D8_9BACT|nr:hypothetical protein [Geomonas limicola]GFO67058.1 hypothetical protein GMLC_06370 [Geomonas limicola]
MSPPVAEIDAVHEALHSYSSLNISEENPMLPVLPLYTFFLNPVQKTAIELSAVLLS